MRHRKAVKKLGRTASHRKATLANLTTAVLDQGRIRTTDAKAKETRRYVDKMITLGKRGDLHAHRQALQFIRDKEVVRKVFGTLASRYSNRNGGYCRIIKLGQRLGDSASVSILELVDQPLAVTETGSETAAEASTGETDRPTQSPG